MSGPVYGLIGRRLEHSYSVPIHRAFGCEDYRLIQLEPEALAGFLSRPDIGGLNVTIPYKRDVIPYCSLSPEAAHIGSVNTIIRQPDGVLKGCNTDVAGFEYLIDSAGISFSGRRVAVLGSGGASLAVQYVAHKRGAESVTVVSRSGSFSYDDISPWRDAEIIVNATPAGMYPDCGSALIDLRLFPDCVGVLDLVYNPLRTELILQAMELGIPASGGLPMLVWQAKAAEEMFFGRTIPDAAAENVLRQMRASTENIILIGMPGCGKTTVGRALAKLAGRQVIDTDAEIERASGMTIPELFSRFGESRFRELEHDEILRAGAQSGKIILTGGGAVKDPANQRPLRRNGRIYHLERDIALLERKGRPLSENADLNEMYRQRKPLYERFRHTAIDNSGTPEEAAQKIWRDFCENTCD